MRSQLCLSCCCCLNVLIMHMVSVGSRKIEPDRKVPIAKMNMLAMRLRLVHRTHFTTASMCNYTDQLNEIGHQVAEWSVICSSYYTLSATPPMKLEQTQSHLRCLHEERNDTNNKSCKQEAQG